MCIWFISVWTFMFKTWHGREFYSLRKWLLFSDLGRVIVALETPFVGGWNNIFLCTGRGSVSRRRVLTFLMDSILFCYVNVDFITIYLFFRVSWELCFEREREFFYFFFSYMNSKLIIYMYMYSTGIHNMIPFLFCFSRLFFISNMKILT